MLAMVFLLAAWPAAIQIGDDFSESQTPVATRWRVEAGKWNVRDGRLQGMRADRSWLIWRGMVAPVRVRAEVEITPMEGSRQGSWGAVGLAAYLDADNYWRLALVENATDKSQRYFELVEQLQGMWQAQATGATRLDTLVTEGEGLWQFGRTYRFVLELDAEQCTGTVFEGTRLIWRRAYALPPEKPAVRAGWPALTLVDMEAEFDNMKATLEQVAIGRPSGPPRALVVDNDLPGADKRSTDWAAGALRRAGFQVETTHAGVLPDRRLTAADYDVLVLPSAQVVAVGTGAAVEAYLSRGGCLMVIADKAPFETQLVRMGDQWVTPADAQARVESAGTVLAVTPDLPSKFGYASNDPQKAVSVSVEAAPEGVEGQVLHFKLADFTGWDSWSVGVPVGSLSKETPVLLFWAKGDAETVEMTVEVNEDDGSRWIATVPLTSEGRRVAIVPEELAYWRDSPKGINRGFPGDVVDPERVVEVRLGLAMSHSPLKPGPKEFWVSSLERGVRLEATSASRLRIPSIEAVSPWYKTFDFPGARKVRTPGGSLAPSVECPVRGVRCTYARPWGRGLTGTRERRWIPILEAVDGAGHRAYAAAAMVATGGPFAGASWSWWGLGPDTLASSGDKIVPAFQTAAKAHAGRLWLLEGGPTQVAYMSDQKPRWGARVLNAGSQAAEVEVVLRATLEGKVCDKMTRRLSVAPMGEGQVEEDWQAPGPGVYEVTVELRAGGQAVERLSTSTRVLAPAVAVSDRLIHREGGQFVRSGHLIEAKSRTAMVGGTPWFPHGVNFWPRYVSGLAPEDYGLGWQVAAHYDPVLVEEDLELAETLGVTAVSIQPPRDAEGLPCLWDFLERCGEHGIYVNLFIAVDPRGFDPEYIRTIIEGGRLACFWQLYAYDITWEPRWGHYEERCRWDPQWADWVSAQYGGVETAAKVWGIEAPRDEKGNLTGPTDDQLATDGPWRVMVAAYRRFVDDFLSAGYGRSCRFIRSLDPEHLISNRAGWGGTGNPHTVRPFQFDPVSGGAHLDFLSPEGYGMRPDKGDFRRWGFVDAYCRWAGNGKPVFWSEFGASIWPGCEAADYERQRAVWANSLELVVFAGANGDAGWWWPGGYRVNERSDYGCVEPWGEPRPSALELKKWARQVCGRGVDDLPVREIAIDRDRDVRGLAGLWEKHLDEYLRLADGNCRVVVKSAGDGRNSADVEILGVGNVSYATGGPVKYLNSEVVAVSVKVGGEMCVPKDDLLWREVTVEVPAGQPAQVDLRLLNTGEAAWACAATAAGKPGAVRLIEVMTGKPLAEISADVPRHGETALRLELERTPEVGQERGTTVQLEAAGRCCFGQVITLRLRGR